MDYKLANWLGMGSNPRLHLELGNSQPKWNTFNIDYGHDGGMPEDWSAWNVKDEQSNLYGTITVARDGSSWSVSNYVKGNGYSLDGVTLSPYQGAGSYQLKCTRINRPAVVPPIITNDGWSGGQGNSDSKPTVGESFWVQDYGVDPKRWTPEGGAIYQSTDELGGTNDGRAYPIRLDEGAPTWKPSGGVGAAYDGLWQIDLKIGSSGTKNSGFCETFYLAERTDLRWGADHYTDGNGGGGRGAYSREVDILETYWTDGCPQINLPNGESTGWNPSPNYGLRMTDYKWSDVGGAPTKDFFTFGCLIRDDKLWLYAYKPDNTQWYCTIMIPKNNNTYNQKGKFVPYMATWRVPDAPNHEPGFKTGHKNFIYLPANDPMIAGKNPKDNPEAFGKALLRLLYVVNYGEAPITRVVVPEKGKSGPSLTIGPSSFLEVSPGQVAGELPWYVAENSAGRPAKAKIMGLPAIISFDRIGADDRLTAVAYITGKSVIGMHDALYVANYHSFGLTRWVGNDVFKLGPRTFVSVTPQQVGGGVPWYVTEKKGQTWPPAVDRLPAVFSFGPLWEYPTPLTAVAYRAK